MKRQSFFCIPSYPKIKGGRWRRRRHLGYLVASSWLFLSQSKAKIRMTYQVFASFSPFNFRKFSTVDFRILTLLSYLLRFIKLIISYSSLCFIKPFSLFTEGEFTPLEEEMAKLNTKFKQFNRFRCDIRPAEARPSLDSIAYKNEVCRLCICISLNKT